MTEKGDTRRRRSLIECWEIMEPKLIRKQEIGKKSGEGGRAVKDYTGSSRQRMRGERVRGEMEGDMREATIIGNI